MMPAFIFHLRRRSLSNTVIGIRWFYCGPYWHSELPWETTKAEEFDPWEFTLDICLPFIHIGFEVQGHNPYAE